MYKFYLQKAKDWIVKQVVRLYLWSHGCDMIVCRGCGQEVQIEMLSSFLESGCLNCGSVKLNAVREVEHEHEPVVS